MPAQQENSLLCLQASRGQNYLMSSAPTFSNNARCNYLPKLADIKAKAALIRLIGLSLWRIMFEEPSFRFRLTGNRIPGNTSEAFAKISRFNLVLPQAQEAIV